jgi:hypothetical protein
VAWLINNLSETNADNRDTKFVSEKPGQKPSDFNDYSALATM